MTLYTFPLKASELAEVESLPANLLSALPVPTQVHIQLPGDVRVRLNVVGDVPQQGDLALQSDEVAAIACAVEHGRATSRDVISWIARKAVEPTFHIDRDVALAGATPPATLRWTFGRVLKEIGAVITSGLMVDVTSSALPRAA